MQLSISTTGHWTIVCDDEWLEAVPAEGTGSAKVGITAQANPLAQQRTSSLTIAYGGAEPAVVPVTQKVSGEESVDLFGSTDEMKAYLKARVEACNYAESVTTTAGGVLKFGFKGAATRGVRKEAIPFFTVNGGGYWAADGVATPVKADADTGFGKFTVPASCVRLVSSEFPVRFQIPAGSVNMRSAVPPESVEEPVQVPASVTVAKAPSDAERSPVHAVPVPKSACSWVPEPDSVTFPVRVDVSESITMAPAPEVWLISARLDAESCS